jgi:undecaprenyl-diphosphatase
MHHARAEEVRPIAQARNVLSARSRDAGLRAACGALTVVAVLAVLVARHPAGNAIDDFVANTLGASDDSRRYQLAGHVSALGSSGGVVVTAVFLAAVCWWRTKSPRLTLLCILAPGVAGLAQWLLKEVVRRPAPGDHVPASALSFPSGHAAGAWSLAATVVLLALVTMASGWPRRLVFAGAAVYAVAIGSARVVVGDHYASDVVAGALLGAGVALGLGALLAGGADGARPARLRIGR